MSSQPATRQSVRSRVVALPERGHPLVARLPVALTPLVGRTADLAAIGPILTNRAVRLVTLTGPGGVGKTRLALALATELGDQFGDGAAFVELAAVADPGLVATTVLRALRREDVGNGPPSEVLAGVLGERDLLMVLDNFEHVLPAGPLLTQLLTTCPRLTILATSRARLHLLGEHEVPIAPLGLPDLSALAPVEELPSFGAIQLWVERARAANPTFALTTENAASVATICHRLDGLPLAIELAAARSNVLAPDAILGRLERRLDLLIDGPRDAPTRLQTMRTAIAWSQDLLTPEEQVLFRRLTVCVGGFSLELAEAVAGDEGQGTRDKEAFSSLDVITSLVSKSLVRPISLGGEPRFGMLETIREFGLERLEESGETTEIRRRHSEWCLALAEEAVTRYFSLQEAASLARIEAEYGNLRSALAWSIERGDAEAALRLVTALGRYWYVHGRLREGQEWLERALALDPSETTAPAARARALSWLEHMTAYQGDFARSAARLERALAIFRALGDRSGEARVMFQIGGLAEFQGDDEQARPWYEHALAIYRDLGDHSRIALVLENLGDAAYRRRDYATAAALANEALTTSRAGGDILITTHSLIGVAQVGSITGNYARAADALNECLALTVAVGHRIGLADALAACAGLVGAAGQPTASARFLGATDALCAEIGAARVFHVDQHQWALAAARAALEPGPFAAAYDAGKGWTVPHAVAEALAAIEQILARPGSPTTGGAPTSGKTGLLSPRELEVLRLLVEGTSDPEIAERLYISRKTASNHVHAILQKLGVASRAAAAALAVRSGLD